MSDPRILIADIESTNLNATFGTILAIGYKWLGNPRVKVPTILDYSKNGMLDDRGLVEHFAEVYSEADAAVWHYGSRFDVPMIQSKLLKYGLPPLAPVPLIDTWRVARYTFKLHSNRLATLQEFLGCEHSKTPITFDDWLKAAHGDKKSLKYVVEHCKRDVQTLEDVYIKLRPFIKFEPGRGLFTDSNPGDCISCGKHTLQRRGYAVTKSSRYPRYQCTNCGKWSRGTRRERTLDLVG